MKTTFTLKTSLLAAAFAMMPLAHAASMAHADYKADKIRINADYKADKAACGSLAGNANDICVEQAKGKDDLAGNAKDVCVQEAKAAETKALADAKLDKKVGEAQTEAADDKRDAAYKVAAEKCDALAGDAKASCVSAAKLKYGKS